MQFTRDNHFVSQGYLKQWSDDGSTVWAYRILVSHESVPDWTRPAIRGVAWHEDLYTTVACGTESDEFEHWIEAEYETPAQESIAKVVRDESLATKDWERLALLLAAQDVRTPTNFVESMQRWEREMPELLDETLKGSVHELEEAHREKRPVATRETATEFLRDLFAITITRPSDPDALGSIKAEIVLGRRLWIESQRHLLTNTAKVLLNHKWSIAEPAAGSTWFTSDHPVVRLNYYEDGTHDLKGGWRNPGSELFMPLSRRHLLFAHIGQDAPDRFTFSPEQTLKIQRFLAERAHRWIFAREPITRVTWLRPRHVSAAAFKAEEEQWRKWHGEQSAAETPSSGS
ncbi:MAG TPA: DUF4238 domain-containing protein [Gemmatimonadales bacterium]